MSGERSVRSTSIGIGVGDGGDGGGGVAGSGGMSTKGISNFRVLDT